MNKPTRIQRKRTKGWKMPPNALYVGRPTIWGNPFIVGKDGDKQECTVKYRNALLKDRTAQLAVRMELRGKNLACYCKLTEPCHADVLLEIANAPAPAHAVRTRWSFSKENKNENQNQSSSNRA